MNRLFCKKTTWAVLLVCLTLPLNLLASDESAWQALRDGEAVAIMRHALAPSGGPASKLTREVCESERNLSQSGRDQAVKIGGLFRLNGIDVANVYSSSLCRCIDTGVLLGFGDPVLLPAIDSFFEDQSKAPEQTEELKQWITQAISKKADANILVTHGYNISHLTGHFVAQGDIVIVGLADKDSLVTLSKISANQL